MQVLRCLDLYSGCGGTSFVDLESAGVVIKTTWAVDKEESMTASFKVNHPNAEVWDLGCPVPGTPFSLDGG